MIRLTNWLDRPLSIDVRGHFPCIVPAATDAGQCAGSTRVTGEHYAALLALPSDDRRRKDLASAEVRADTGAFEDNVVPGRPGSENARALAHLEASH